MERKWNAAVQRLSVGIVYSDQNFFTTEGTEEHGESPTLITLTLEEADNWAAFAVHSRYRTYILGRFYSLIVLSDR